MKLKIFVSDEREKKARKAKTGKAAKEPKAKQAKAVKPKETKPPKETDEKAKARRAFWARKKAIEKKNANKTAEEPKQD